MEAWKISVTLFSHRDLGRPSTLGPVYCPKAEIDLHVHHCNLPASCPLKTHLSGISDFQHLH